MRHFQRTTSIAAFFLGFVVLVAAPAAAAERAELTLAYVGPGAGLGMIGSLLAVVAAILLGIFGLLLYPIKLLLKMKRERAASQASPSIPAVMETPATAAVESSSSPTTVASQS
ncbi:MAG: hypothetical protein ACKV0T_25130 [Planctomycetales bacterium]